MPWDVFFGWPAGGVWSNLVASLIWATPAGIALARKLRRQHAERMSQAERHHVEQMAQATAHHNELKLQVARHAENLANRADAHHEALKAYIAAPEPKQGPS
jgi:hypothetical protein